MKNQKCIIFIDTDRIEIWEKEVINTIVSLCDVKSFYLFKGERKRVPFFYKSHVCEVNALMELYRNIPFKNELLINDSEKIDFIFSLNADFGRDLPMKTPVIYINKPCAAESVIALKEFMRSDSYIRIGFSVCYKNTHYSLTESKLKMDRFFLKNNLLFFKQALPEICIQSISLFKNNFSRIYLLPEVNNEMIVQSSAIYHFDLLFCYLLMPFRLFKKGLDFFCYWEQWHIGIVEDDIEDIVSSEFRIDHIRWLPRIKKNQFIADPFAIKYNNSLYIFAELWDSADPKGKIVWSDESSTFSKWNILFDQKTHLSYPFLLKNDSNIYCLPESSESGFFVVYSAVDFPCQWSNGEILFQNFRMVDASILFYNNKYWLFAARDKGDSAFELYIWYSDKINGDWTPHPLNPVKRDITSARPAGPPFVENNIIYRPAQDCSDSYGSRIVINRVTILSETDFREEAAGVVKGPAASPYPDGIHTISVIDDVIVIDGKRKIFTLFNYRILSYKIKKLARIFFK